MIERDPLTSQHVALVGYDQTGYFDYLVLNLFGLSHHMRETFCSQCIAVFLFSNLNKIYVGYFHPVNVTLYTVLNRTWGELMDKSTKSTSLEYGGWANVWTVGIMRTHQ